MELEKRLKKLEEERSKFYEMLTYPDNDFYMKCKTIAEKHECSLLLPAAFKADEKMVEDFVESLESVSSDETAKIDFESLLSGRDGLLYECRKLGIKINENVENTVSVVDYIIVRSLMDRTGRMVDCLA